MTVIQRLIAARKARGWSVYRVGQLSGITPANLYKTEAGKTSMSLNNLEKWADALDLKIAVVEKTEAE